MSLRTRYEFTLPRGYVDDAGTVHRTGTMRLATARDELEPLRDPRVDGPEDPRLTVLVLARVVETLGTLELVTPAEVEELFAIDLAFLQDFYGVINFGGQAEYEALMESQSGLSAPDPGATPKQQPAEPGPVSEPSSDPVGAEPELVGSGSARAPRPGRSAIEELPGQGR